MNCRVIVLGALFLGLIGCSHPQTRGQAADENEDRDFKYVQVIGDATEVGNIYPTPISGVALVYGLDGTGGTLPGQFRIMLENKMLKDGVKNVKEILASPNYALVLVSSAIPPGTRRGDTLDLEITLPPQSKATSLHGGYLRSCDLTDFDLKRNSQGVERLLTGHVLATACEGPLVFGFEDDNEQQKLRRAHIWGGGISRIDQPFSLYLNEGQRFTAVANNIANSINMAFPDDARKQNMVLRNRLMMVDAVASGINSKFPGSGLGHGDAAHADSKDRVSVNVPLEYRLNPERYLRVVRLIPLHETPDTASRYRARLNDLLLDPKDTIRAALRLEALGKESIPTLKKGLASHDTLVRFASAESLTYLGTTQGIEELARLAEKHESLRGHCLTAIASLNESSSQMRLTELMKSSIAEVRVGAFRGLLALHEADVGPSGKSEVGGEKVNDAFWLHHVAPASAPLIHIATARKAEIVIFGEAPALVPPFKIVAGEEFVITAEDGDTRCTVSRYAVSRGKMPREQCSTKVEDVLKTIALMGGEYADAVEFLRGAQREKCLTCAVATDALPSATPVELLAAAGSEASKFKDHADYQQDVLTVQHDLGIVPSQATATPTTVRPQRQ